MAALESCAAVRYLVGPGPEDAAHAEELLPVAPSVWHLTGFLVPFEAPPEEREGDDADGEIDVVHLCAEIDVLSEQAKPRARPRTWTEVLPLLADVARGVSAAHQAGLVHRDFKPKSRPIACRGCRARPVPRWRVSRPSRPGRGLALAVAGAAGLRHRRLSHLARDLGER